MKKTLLLSLATVAAMTAVAQQKSAVVQEQQKKAFETADVQLVTTTSSAENCLEEFAVEKTAENSYIRKAPTVKDGYVQAWFYRPAGVWYGVHYSDLSDGKSYVYVAPYLMAPPFKEITWTNASEGADKIQWTYQQWDIPTQSFAWLYSTDNLVKQTLILENDTCPTIEAWNGATYSSYYYHPGKASGSGSSRAYEDGSEVPCKLLSRVNYRSAFSNTAERILWLSPHFYGGQTNRDHTYLYSTTHSNGAAATAYQTEQGSKGRWYGRNEHSVDALCSAFERPAAPYALSHVGVRYGYLKIAEGATPKVRVNVYKLDEVPAYDSVSVQITPGELIGFGEVELNSETAEGGILVFDLLEEDEDFTFNVTPTVDYPILVEFTDYNQDDILDILVYQTGDVYDEGHGECAFLKRNYTSGTYYLGLNNFFTSGERKGGFTVFIDPEYHFMRWMDDTELDFDVAGSTFTTEFYSSLSAEEIFAVDENGEELPEWITVTLADSGEPNSYGFRYVTPTIKVDALPDGETGRQCKIKLLTTGTYVNLTIRQGEVSSLKGDVDGDGVVTVADVSALVNIVLAGGTDAVADINEDGAVTVADVSALVNIILAGE